MLLQADATTIPLEDKSVHCAVFSPPYWGLRKYSGDQGRIWGGEPECQHEWVNREIKSTNYVQGNPEFARPHREKKNFIAHSSTCSKCGAWYGGLGLEPTPELHIQNMVVILREVRRVLRDDGVVWLNYGDCFAGGGRGDSPTPKQASNRGHGKTGPGYRGIAQGSLMLMPHRLAIALQEPYYLGRIKKEVDRIWLAAMIETEGCMFVHRRKAGSDVGGGRKRKKDTFGAGLEIANTNPEIVNRCLEITGLGSICEQSPRQNRRREQVIYRWNLRTNQCKDVIAEVYPHMITESKRHQARILIAMPASGEDANKSWESVKALHNGKPTTIDFPRPNNKGLWEPGWIIRNDVVWSKSNPMPESVGGWFFDAESGKLTKKSWRHTRSHEYIFQLVKKMGYYCNQEAVREPHARLWDESNKGNMAHPTFKAKEQGSGFSHHGPYPLPNPSGRNPRSVMDVPTAPYKGAHYATFPPKLIAPLIRASCPRRACPECGQAWAAVVERGEVQGPGHDGYKLAKAQSAKDDSTVKGRSDGWWPNHAYEPTVTDYRPTCECGHEDYKPGIVLDIFVGSGTVPMVAKELQRRWVGMDISYPYLDEQARYRSKWGKQKTKVDDLPLFQNDALQDVEIES